jgi:hypothetical protein
MKTHAVWLLACLALSIVGCRGNRLEWPRPLGWPAGTVEAQRNNANLHDPYPDPDTGPAIVGGRPREFQKPLPEPVRNRWLTDSWWQR